jgi:hypothetical protein
MHMVATCFNIGGVVKMGCATWEQALNQTLMAECFVVLKRSCGSLKKILIPKRTNTASSQ